jgi:dTMP kinase
VTQSTQPGRFITFEGIDGAGKSSHIAFVADWVRARGVEVIATREPGGTLLGETLREMVLNKTMHAETELLLVFASRREHLAAVIEPALAAGTCVVCDRFTDSSYAYQCGGRRLPTERIAVLEQFVHPTRQPDITFLFDAPISLARQRLDSNTPQQDKFEREQQDFFARVRDAYLARAAAFPARIKVVNSAQSLESVRADLVGLLEAHFGAHTQAVPPKGTA